MPLLFGVQLIIISAWALHTANYLFSSWQDCYNVLKILIILFTLFTGLEKQILLLCLIKGKTPPCVCVCVCFPPIVPRVITNYWCQFLSKTINPITFFVESILMSFPFNLQVSASLAASKTEVGSVVLLPLWDFLKPFSSVMHEVGAAAVTVLCTSLLKISRCVVIYWLPRCWVSGWLGRPWHSLWTVCWVAW